MRIVIDEPKFGYSIQTTSDRKTVIVGIMVHKKILGKQTEISFQFDINLESELLLKDAKLLNKAIIENLTGVVKS